MDKASPSTARSPEWSRTAAKHQGAKAARINPGASSRPCNRAYWRWSNNSNGRLALSNVARPLSAPYPNTNRQASAVRPCAARPRAKHSGSPMPTQRFSDSAGVLRPNRLWASRAQVWPIPHNATRPTGTPMPASNPGNCAASPADSTPVSVTPRPYNHCRDQGVAMSPSSTSACGSIAAACFRLGSAPTSATLTSMKATYTHNPPCQPQRSCNSCPKGQNTAEARPPNSVIRTIAGRARSPSRPAMAANNASYNDSRIPTPSNAQSP